MNLIRVKKDRGNGGGGGTMSDSLIARTYTLDTGQYEGLCTYKTNLAAAAARDTRRAMHAVAPHALITLRPPGRATPPPPHLEATHK
jgi:hypothetical protein